MGGYKKFRVEALHNDTKFNVLVKGWFFWKCGFVWTNYFSCYYETKRDALDAIERYKNRFTDA
jgi:hypothetical protein